MNQHFLQTPDAKGAFTTRARFHIKEITTEVVWSATGGPYPLCVVAVVVDSANQTELKMHIPEQQLRAGVSRNTGEARRQVDAALQAIDEVKKVYGTGIFDSPLSVLAGGPAH